VRGTGRCGVWAVTLSLLIAPLVGAAAVGGATAVAAVAAAAAPRIGRTVVIAPVSGSVFVTSPMATRTRLRSPTMLPVGSVLDTRTGVARVTFALTRSGETQRTEFQGGQIQLGQTRLGDGTLDARLVGGKFQLCRAGRAARAGGTSSIRHVHTRFGNNVRVDGRRASGYGGFARAGRSRRRAHAAGADVGARVSTASWDTVDTCTGTLIDDQTGDVSAEGRAAPSAFALQPSETIQYQCSAVDAPKPFCASVQILEKQDDPARTPLLRFSLVVRNPKASQYTLTFQGPGNTPHPLTYPLSPPAKSGFSHSIVSCLPNQGTGTYTANWRFGSGTVVTTVFNVLEASSSSNEECTSSTGVGVPGDLTRQQSSAHFVADYSSLVSDPNFASSAAVSATLALAETAYDYDTSTLGMPPYAGGARKIDIYVDSPPDALTLSAPTTRFPPEVEPVGKTGAVIYLPPAVVNDFSGNANLTFQIPVAVYAALQDAIRLSEAQDTAGVASPTVPQQSALLDSTQYWAAANVLSQPPMLASSSLTLTPALGQPLDCTLTCAYSAVYRDWRFYQYLSQRFGPTIVTAILQADAQLIGGSPSMPAMDQALNQVLSEPAYDSSLASAVGGYVLADLARNWTAPWVGSGGQADGGANTAALTAAKPSFTNSVTVQDLSARYFKVSVPAVRGTCAQETATFTSAVPTGGSLPGAALQLGSSDQLISGTPTGNSTQEVQVPIAGCQAATVWLPVVDETSDAQPIKVSVTGQLSIATGS
jgi:hypothetical protein